jgi:hypothetical protein
VNLASLDPTAQVTSPIYLGHPKWLAAFVDLLGYQVGVAERHSTPAGRQQGGSLTRMFMD